ncbi:MAG: class I SAM-dependent methyltransferase [Actinomycetota bacterium]
MSPQRAPAPPPSLRAEARRLYGVDPIAYEAGRPEYPERVYEVLATRCGVSVGTKVVEIGPGTGRVTRRLLELGACVVGVEPDASSAAHLKATLQWPALEVLHRSFEEAPLSDDTYGCAAAAMSFHWVDQAVGLTKLGRILRPGGWAALWWTIFADPDRSDPFRDAVRDLLPEGAGPSRRGPPSFELDVTQRKNDLADRAGLTEVQAELIRWTIRMTTTDTRALYASMIAALRLPPDERSVLLDTLTAVVENDFGGGVTRHFVTALYTGRKPETSARLKRASGRSAQRSDVREATARGRAPAGGV